MLMVTLQRERQHNRDAPAPAPAPPEMLVYVFYKNCFPRTRACHNQSGTGERRSVTRLNNHKPG
jgi:hypothetical protein